MTIEVKQLIIKSTVTNERQMDEQRNLSSVDIEKIRAAILEECRELIAAQLDEMRER